MPLSINPQEEFPSHRVYPETKSWGNLDLFDARDPVGGRFSLKSRVEKWFAGLSIANRRLFAETRRMPQRLGSPVFSQEKSHRIYKSDSKENQ